MWRAFVKMIMRLQDFPRIQNHSDIYILRIFEKTVTNQNSIHENFMNFPKRNQFTSFSHPISHSRKRDCNVANISLLFSSGCETGWKYLRIVCIRVREHEESRPFARRALHPLGICKISARTYADQKWPPWRQYHEGDPCRKTSRASTGRERKQWTVDTW